MNFGAKMIVNLSRNVFSDELAGRPAVITKIDDDGTITAKCLRETGSWIPQVQSEYSSRSPYAGALVHWLTYEIFRDYWNNA